MPTTTQRQSETCPRCKGRCVDPDSYQGAKHEDDLAECSACQGTGEVPVDATPEPMSNILAFPRPMSVRMADYERDGCRPLMGDEADAVKYMDVVTVLDVSQGDFMTGRVIGVTDDKIRAQFPRGAIFVFDTDNPDYWGDGEVRDRKPPIAIEDGREFVIVTEKPPTASAEPPRAEVYNALKASRLIGELKAEVKQLTAAKDALVADVTRLQQQVNALASARVA